VRVIVPEQVPPTNGPSLHVIITVPQFAVAVASLGLQAGTSSRHATLKSAGHEIAGTSPVTVMI
jgi:hypothetical protein